MQNMEEGADKAEQAIMRVRRLASVRAALRPRPIGIKGPDGEFHASPNEAAAKLAEYWGRSLAVRLTVFLMLILYIAMSER